MKLNRLGMGGVLEINDIGALGQLRDTWADLHARTPRAAFFETPEWLQIMWPAFPRDGRRPRVLLLEQEGSPVAIVPFSELVDATRLGSLRVLSDPLEGWASGWTPLSAASTDGAFALALTHIATGPRTWDTISMRWPLGVGHDAVGVLRGLGIDSDLTLYERASVVRCDQFRDWTDYLGSRPKKVRHELLRQRRQLAKSGAVEHRVWIPTESDPCLEAYDACVEIASRSWQATSGIGHTLCTAFARPFFREAHLRASRLGMAQIDLLYLSGRPVAYFYSYRSRGDVVGMRMGFDAGAPTGSGSVLTSHVIQSCIERGDWRLELGPGSERFKRDLRTDLESSYRLEAVNPDSWRGRTVQMIRRLRRFAGPAAVAASTK